MMKWEVLEKADGQAAGVTFHWTTAKLVNLIKILREKTYSRAFLKVKEDWRTPPFALLKSELQSSVPNFETLPGITTFMC